MARSVQEQLDAIDTLIASLESAGGVEEYQQGTERQRLAQLTQLYRERRLLQEQRDAEGADTFSLLDPIQK